MILHIGLSDASIQQAIRELQVIAENVDRSVDRIVETLTNEGAEVARAAYGEYPVVTTPIAEGKIGEIIVAGDMPLIAEFGAGQATMPVLFANQLSEVYEGSYSESNLSKSHEYYKFGSWHFGGEYFTEIPARHGLLDAKQYIIDRGTEIAAEVMQL